jgi:hypothetical protein
MSSENVACFAETIITIGQMSVQVATMPDKESYSARNSAFREARGIALVDYKHWPMQTDRDRPSGARKQRQLDVLGRNGMTCSSEPTSLLHLNCDLELDRCSCKPDLLKLAPLIQTPYHGNPSKGRGDQRAM